MPTGATTPMAPMTLSGSKTRMARMMPMALASRDHRRHQTDRCLV
jgi:hypothetical protein